MSGYVPDSKSSEWETPRALFDRLHRRYQFTLDAAAGDINALCEHFFMDVGDRSAFENKWTGRVFCNPPYGRQLRHWVDHVLDVVMPLHEPELVVMLLPARTDTRWAQRLLRSGNVRIQFLPGRLKFTLGGVEQSPAPFASMLAFIGWEW